MKKTILILGICLTGLTGFSQQNNEKNLELLHTDQNNMGNSLDESQIKLTINDGNTLVINSVDSKNDFENNLHEKFHGAFRVDDNQFNYEDGVYTSNEYVINYKLEPIKVSTK